MATSVPRFRPTQPSRVGRACRNGQGIDTQAGRPVGEVWSVDGPHNETLPEHYRFASAMPSPSTENCPHRPTHYS